MLSAWKALTLSPTLNLEPDLGALTTFPARSRPLIQGNSGSPNPKSLELLSVRWLTIFSFNVRCFPVYRIQSYDFNSYQHLPCIFQFWYRLFSCMRISLLWTMK